MRFWPEWSNQIARDPPEGYPPRAWRFYARLMAFDKLIGLFVAALFVAMALGLLVAVALGLR